MRVMDEKHYVVNGFRAAAVNAGLKKGNGADLALIFSERPAVAAGVFTTNRVKAAPVLVTMKHIERGRARAIVANAGNANACTGLRGLNDATKTAAETARMLKVDEAEVLVASTGVIGAPLNMEAILAAMPDLVHAISQKGIPEAARAIMTTDSFPKMSVFDGLAGGVPYRVLGMAKGAGMIMPHMATMLCFILSDIVIDAAQMDGVLKGCVEETFNRITVDGDTSTNDMVVMMANGDAGNAPLTSRDTEEFRLGLTRVMGDLARMIVKDGEGATKLVDISVKNARSPQDASRGARTVANSSLVKTALYGQDPNWGRIMAALGRAGIEMIESKVDIWINEIQIVSGGLGVGAEAEKRAAEIMTGPEFAMTIDLHEGTHHDRILTCDLTHDYVSINADYRS
jgi:glutamate N-acetyltransferase/amino-acid N-acetyltransferase